MTEEWIRLQNELRKDVIKECDDSNLISTITKVGGLDISFHVTNGEIACVTFVVLEIPSLMVLYEDSSLVKMGQPYIPGFLGFREVEFFKQKLQNLQEKDAGLLPELVLVDGNGILHFNRCGSASHLGVTCNIPTIGVAKNLYVIEDEGILRDENHTKRIKSMQKKGDRFSIETIHGEVLGMAVRTSDNAKNPIYVSIGHKCDLKSAVEVVLMCSNGPRIPEPIRQADMRSRQFLRDKFSTDYVNQKKKD